MAQNSWRPSEGRGTYFIGADGDDMGSMIGAHILRNEVEKAKRLSSLIKKAEKIVQRYAAKNFGGSFVIAGGDDILIQAPAKRFDPAKIEGMRDLYHQITGATMTAGVGDRMEDAAKALATGKNTGKNKTVYWEPSMQEEYERLIKAKCNDLVTKCRQQGGLREAARTILGFYGGRVVVIEATSTNLSVPSWGLSTCDYGGQVVVIEAAGDLLARASRLWHRAGERRAGRRVLRQRHRQDRLRRLAGAMVRSGRGALGRRVWVASRLAGQRAVKARHEVFRRKQSARGGGGQAQARPTPYAGQSLRHIYHRIRAQRLATKAKRWWQSGGGGERGGRAYRKALKHTARALKTVRGGS